MRINKIIIILLISLSFLFVGCSDGKINKINTNQNNLNTPGNQYKYLEYKLPSYNSSNIKTYKLKISINEFVKLIKNISISKENQIIYLGKKFDITQNGCIKLSKFIQKDTNHGVIYNCFGYNNEEDMKYIINQKSRIEINKLIENDISNGIYNNLLNDYLNYIENRSLILYNRTIDKNYYQRMFISQLTAKNIYKNNLNINFSIGIKNSSFDLINFIYFGSKDFNEERKNRKKNYELCKSQRDFAINQSNQLALGERSGYFIPNEDCKDLIKENNNSKFQYYLKSLNLVINKIEQLNSYYKDCNKLFYDAYKIKKLNYNLNDYYYINHNTPEVDVKQKLFPAFKIFCTNVLKNKNIFQNYTDEDLNLVLKNLKNTTTLNYLSKKYS